MSHSSRIAKNTLYLYLRLLLVMGVSLYTVRIVLQALGVQDYGIYAVAAASVAIFAFISGALSQASQRFLAIDIGQGDHNALGRTFNAILLLHVGVAVLVVLLGETAGLWLFNEKLRIPESRLVAANYAYQCSIAASVLVIMQTPYTALIVAREQLWFFAFAGLLEAILKLLIAFTLLHVAGDKLELYALLILGAALILFLLYAGFSTIGFRPARLRPHRELQVYRNLTGFIGWSFIGNAAAAGRTQGVNLLLNVFFGPIANAAYGVMSQVQYAVVSFTGSLQTALSPQIYQNYGRGDLESVHALTTTGSKASFLLLLIVVAPVVHGLDFLLHSWLGIVPDNAAIFVGGVLIVLLIDTASLPLIAALAATGRIKWYQISVGGLLLMNVPLSYLGFLLTGEPEAFLYIAAVLSVFALLLRLLFLRHMIAFRISTYVERTIVPILAVSAFAWFTILGIEKWLGVPDSLTDLVVNSLVISTLILVACLAFGLSKQERTFIFAKLRSAAGK